MTLNKVKSDITSVFNTLKNMDLTVDNNGEYSIATLVDLDLATRYPTNGKVTPHLAYLYNTRAGWAQYINRHGFTLNPINQFVSSGWSNEIVQSHWLNSDKTTRDGLFLKCRVYNILESRISIRTNSDSRDLPEYMKNNLNRMSSSEVEFHDGLPYSSWLNRNVFKYKEGGKPRTIYQSHMSDLTSGSSIIIHDDGVTKVGLQPLRAMRSDTGAVIGSTNQYIQANDNMTILIYTYKLVYIQKLNNSYDYKIYTYPQMNLIKTGTENSLRGIYIKNKLTRTDLIGPVIQGSSGGLKFLNGFILDFNQYGVSHIIDVYTMTCPKFINISDDGRVDYNLIYYI